MSVLIKGMEMPVIELEWTIRRGADGKWYAIDTNAETSDGEWHEIVPVPPHGRLIDADVLFDRMEFEIKHFVPTDEFSRGVLSGYRSASRASRYVSTIIPASEEGET